MTNGKTSSNLKYPVVRNAPVARFYYAGSHSHPIRRTVILTESTSKIIRGYEVREGTEVRALTRAPIKSYSKDKIAMIGQCGTRLRRRTPVNQHADSTFARTGLLDALTTGF